MSANGSLANAISEAASNPKLAATVSTTTAAVGAMAAGDFIHGALVNLSMMAGIIVTLLLGRVHWAKYKLLKRQLSDLEAGKQIGDIDV